MERVNGRYRHRVTHIEYSCIWAGASFMGWKLSRLFDFSALQSPAPCFSVTEDNPWMERMELVEAIPDHSDDPFI